MNLNAHSALAKALMGTHAFLSPSNAAWLNYEEDKLDRVYFANQAARRGTEEHEFAYKAIRLRIKLPETPKTINMYVNDAIGFRMTPEVLLYYSDNCYGHADCLSFNNNTLRVHDLKTGIHATSMAQLEIYAALFCLEYKMRPFDIKIELRIYQNNAVKLHIPEPDSIVHIMQKIISFDKRIDYLKQED